MAHFYRSLLVVPLFFVATMLNAQDSLLNLLGDNQPKIQYTTATFKTTRVVLGQSVENPFGGTMLFVISHHFGQINSGFYNFFGLDQATTRLGLEYGITNWIEVGFGRSTYQKTWDGLTKVKILRQCKGERKIPLSISFYANTAINSLDWENPDRKNYFSSRLQYCFEFIFARKFNEYLSFQLQPVWIHRNLVTTTYDHNDILAVGAGGRCKISKRVSVNAEYYYLLPNQNLSGVYNSFSLGVDIETGGHVFQLFLTNSQGTFEEAFITENNGNWANGDIFLGFNISRVFTIIKPKVK
jgi:hypothetical protein